MPARKSPSRVQTTLRMPKKVFEEARALVNRRKTNLNDFIVNAVCAYLEMLRRREIDSAFAAMSGDASFQREAEEVTRSFQESDWEALQLHEKDSERANATR
jgi:hypothetical protein